MSYSDDVYKNNSNVTVYTALAVSVMLLLIVLIVMVFLNWRSKLRLSNVEGPHNPGTWQN